MVIGVIAVLAGLLVPSLAAVRRETLALTCLSGLRQLSLAHTSYMGVNKGRFADVGLPHSSLGNPARSFVNTLKPYLDGPLSMRSPLDESPHWSTDLGGDGTPVSAGSPPLYRVTSYGMNNYLSRTYSPAAAIEGPGAGADALHRVPRPSDTVCFLRMADRGAYASSDHPHVEVWGSFPNPAVAAASQVQINSVDQQKPGRSSRSTWAFVDGHTSAAEFSTVFESATANKFDPDL